MNKKRKYIVFIAHEFHGNKRNYRNAYYRAFRKSAFCPCFADVLCFKGDGTALEGISEIILKKIDNSAFVICDLTSYRKGVKVNYNALLEAGVESHA